MTTTEFVYVTYIAATPEKVWKALTDADISRKYWGNSNVSDWKPGSPWKHVRHAALCGFQQRRRLAGCIGQHRHCAPISAQRQ